MMVVYVIMTLVTRRHLMLTLHILSNPKLLLLLTYTDDLVMSGYNHK